MRKRWRFQWGPEALGVLAIIWFFAGMVAYIVASCITTPHANGSNWWAFGAWLGPFALVALVLLFCGIYYGAIWAIKHPPIGRETENSPDIREVYRDG